MMRFLTILLLYAFCGCGLYTQAQSTHVYEDSAILYPPEQTEAPAVMADQEMSAATEQTEDDESVYFADTFIVHNRNFLSPDSLRLLKEDKKFFYAGKLDSLLKDLKKKETEKELQNQRQSEKASSSPGTKPSTPSFIENVFRSNALQYFLWGLAALFVLFVVYKLIFTEGGFRRQATPNNIKVLEEEDATPTTGKNFDSFIAKAVNENNYRLAVRYLYLQLLQKLSAAGAIEFAVDKTNTEYVRELTGKPYKEAVKELTRYYDYVWYGAFEMDAAMYATVESKFKSIVL